MIVLQGTRESVDVLQFSSDGRGLAAPYSGGVQLWSDLTDGSAPTVTMPFLYGGSIYLTAEGQMLWLDESLTWVFVHDLATATAIKVPVGLLGRGAACDLTPDGRYLVVCQTGIGMERPGCLFCRPMVYPEILVWSVTSHRWLNSRPLFLAGGEQFVVLEWDPALAGHRFVYVTRQTSTGAVAAEVPATGDSFHDFVQSADKRLIAGRRGAWVAVFRADDLGAEPARFRNDNRKEFTGLAFHPSGRYLAATSNDATVKLYDTATWAVAEVYDWDIGRPRSVAFSPNGMLAAAGGDKGKIVVWDVDL
jgi:WD40 repeat protein